MSDAHTIEGRPDERSSAAAWVRAIGLGLLIGLGIILPFPWPFFVAVQFMDGGAALVWLPLVALAAGWFVATVVLGVYWTAYRRRFRYIIGSTRVEVHRGVVFRQQVQVPYARIQEVTLGEGPLQRHQMLATIKIQTAAAGAQTKAEVKLFDVSRDGARELVDAIVDRARAAGAPVAT